MCKSIISDFQNKINKKNNLKGKKMGLRVKGNKAQRKVNVDAETKTQGRGEGVAS